MNGPVQANAGAIFWQTENIAVNAPISGSASLTIQPQTVNRSIGLNGPGDLNLTADEIAELQDGFRSIQVGRSDGSGTISTNGATFLDPVRILAPMGAGTVNVNGTLAGNGNDASVSIRAATINLAAGAFGPAISTHAAAVELTGNVKLLANTRIETSFGSAGGDVTFKGTINGGFALTIDAGSASTGANSLVSFTGAVSNPAGGASIGGSVPLTSFRVEAAQIHLLPQVITTGAQSYTALDGINIFAGTLRTKSGGSVSLVGPVYLNAELPIITEGTGGNITFGGTVDSVGGKDGALRINAGTSGSIAFQSAVGAGERVKQLEVVNGAKVTFSSSAAVVESMKLTAAEIDFNGGATSVSGATLTLETPVVTQEVEVAVSPNNSTDTGALDLTRQDIAALADGFSSVLIGRTTGTGGITIGSGVTFTDPVTFRQSSRSGFINIMGPLTGIGDAAFTFTGSATNLNGNITTAGGEISAESVNLLADVALSTSGGAVTFIGALRDTGVGNHDLVVTTGAGNVTFKGSVGTSGALLGDVVVNSGGITKVESGLVAKSFQTDAAGSTQLKGNQIKATGAGGILLNDPVQLNSSISLLAAGSAPITLGSVNSAPGKTYALKLKSSSGNIYVHGAVGAQDAVGALTVKTAGDVSFEAEVIAKSANFKGAAVTVNDVTTTGGQVLNGSRVAFTGSISAAALTVTSASNITSSELFEVSGKAAFKAKNQKNISLTNPENTFGTLALIGRDVTIVENGDLNLVATKAAGTLDLTATGSVLQTGSLKARTLTIDSGESISIAGKNQRISRLGSITADGQIVILGGGSDLLITAPIKTSDADVIISANTRATSHNIKNVFGPNAIQIDGSGRFVLYSYSKTKTTLNGLPVNAEEFGKRYPAPPAGGGNTAIYVVR